MPRHRVAKTSPVFAKNRLFLLAFIVFLVTFFAVGYFFVQSQMVPPKETMTVTLSPKWVHQAQFAGVYVAIAKGFYEDIGLTVKLDEYTTNSFPADKVASGQSTFALVSANQALTAYSQGAQIQAIAAFYQISPYAVVSLKEQGIISPRDLKGRVLSTKGGPGAETDSIYSILFRAAGLTANDVRLSYLPFGTSEYQDLIDGKADAMGLYRTDQLYFFAKNSVAYNILSPEQYGGAIYNDVLVTQKSFLDEHPTAAKNFVAATIKGWEYAFANPDEAVEITMPYITSAAYKDAAHQKYILEQSRLLMQPSAKVAIGSMDIALWAEYYQNLRKLGVLQKEFDVRELVTTSYLPQ
jgi:ABC-type nitrate/sulfonate/bicarbonate transport system substrate-binding protein